MNHFLYFALLFLSLSFSCAATEIDQQSAPRLLVHILDYLAKDYAGAVSSTGTVISESEYREQMEFARSAVAINGSLTDPKGSLKTTADFARLEDLVKLKSPPEKVSNLARQLQTSIVDAYHLEVFPSRWPNLETGRTLFVQNCASCHGLNGDGNGVAGQELNPRPANFLSLERMSEVSPFAAFNSIRLGVSGTAMPAFRNLSDEEIWALSFYVSSLRYIGNAEAVGTKLDSGSDLLKRTSSLTDSALEESFLGSINEKHLKLVATRTYRSSEDKPNYLAFAKNMLEDAEINYRNGEFEKAKSKALQAYLEGIEPIEPRARATDPEALAELEERMSAVRSNIEGKSSVEAIANATRAAAAQIDLVANSIEHHDMSPSVAFLAAFAILLREGFEAVLIILSLLGVIRAAGSRTAALAVHGGWLAAIFCGLLAWIFSGWVIAMSGASREMLEGVTSVFAVIVLLYVGFWLHRQAEIGRWKEFLGVKIKRFVHGKNLVGLAAISFFAVFREAFETVLFLRAIWFEGGAATQNALTLGVFVSLALVIGLSWIALNYSKKLPLRQLFTLSSILMLFLATILAGKGVHSIQETGWFKITTLRFAPRLEIAGIYPTAQTIAAQIIVASLVIVLWVYGRKPSSFPIEKT